MAIEFRGEPDGKGKRVAIVVSKFNEIVTRRLLEGCEKALREQGVADKDITVAWVPGSFEIPATALLLAESDEHDAIVCLGAVVRGETPHFDYICREVARGVADVSLETSVPVIFGVLTTENTDQALQRSGGKVGHKGVDAARAALEMADLFRRLEESEDDRP
ncbi:MAG: 6,7-dimethyl-8-ribityllumazine synthase [Planctomycetota bacterium]|nr:6,7-dimethyl-8-ribityllumazine synthase [Planctomycetota bacterium]